ncbi:MAG: Flp family type IVb pilin [Coriobacteriia bacterium]|nr:Flp family type IVb pilin [Coriobacteriia bacterium]
MLNLYVKARTWMDSDEGATAVEYGIMVALIAVVIIVAVTALGTNLSTMFTYVKDKIVVPG